MRSGSCISLPRLTSELLTCFVSGSVDSRRRTRPLGMDEMHRNLADDRNTLSRSSTRPLGKAYRIEQTNHGCCERDEIQLQRQPKCQPISRPLEADQCLVTRYSLRMPPGRTCESVRYAKRCVSAVFRWAMRASTATPIQSRSSALGSGDLTALMSI